MYGVEQHKPCLKFICSILKFSKNMQYNVSKTLPIARAYAMILKATAKCANSMEILNNIECFDDLLWYMYYYRINIILVRKRAIDPRERVARLIYRV